MGTLRAALVACLVTGCGLITDPAYPFDAGSTRADSGSTDIGIDATKTMDVFDASDAGTSDEDAVGVSDVSDEGMDVAAMDLGRDVSDEDSGAVVIADRPTADRSDVTVTVTDVGNVCTPEGRVAQRLIAPLSGSVVDDDDPMLVFLGSSPGCARTRVLLCPTPAVGMDCAEHLPSPTEWTAGTWRVRLPRGLRGRGTVFWTVAEMPGRSPPTPPPWMYLVVGLRPAGGASVAPPPPWGAVPDFDRNGRSEVVFGLENQGRAMVFFSTGSGLFRDPVPITDPAQGFGRIARAVGDIDGDGFPDIGVGSEGPPFVRVFRGGPTNETFAQRQLAPMVPTMADVSLSDFAGIGDWNDDGFGDLAAALHGPAEGGTIYLTVCEGPMFAQCAEVRRFVGVAERRARILHTGARDGETPFSTILLGNNRVASFLRGPLDPQSRRPTIVANDSDRDSLLRSFNRESFDGALCLGDWTRDGNPELVFLVGQRMHIVTAQRPLGTRVGVEAMSFSVRPQCERLEAVAELGGSDAPDILCSSRDGRFLVGYVLPTVPSTTAPFSDMIEVPVALSEGVGLLITAGEFVTPSPTFSDDLVVARLSAFETPMGERAVLLHVRAGPVTQSNLVNLVTSAPAMTLGMVRGEPREVFLAPGR